MKGVVGTLLKWYYSIYSLFGYCCLGAEMFFLFLYLGHPHNISGESGIFIQNVRSSCKLVYRDL